MWSHLVWMLLWMQDRKGTQVREASPFYLSNNLRIRSNLLMSCLLELLTFNRVCRKKDEHSKCPHKYIYIYIYSPTQLSQRLQCEARGGRKILQVKQYFSFTVCPLMITSFVLGGGRYPPELEPFAISKQGNTIH